MAPKQASTGSHSRTECCVAVYAVDLDSHFLCLVLVTQSPENERGATLDHNGWTTAENAAWFLQLLFGLWLGYSGARGSMSRIEIKAAQRVSRVLMQLAV